MIRGYEEADLDGVINVWHEVAKVSYNSLSQSCLESIKKDIAEKYMPHTRSWVVEEDGEVVAFIALLDNVAGGLFVLPDYQNQGVAKALLEHVKNIVGTISLDVLKESTRVLKFYEKCGFTPTKEGLCPLTGLRSVTVEIEA